MRLLRSLARPLHQVYAWVFGYFWIPCPVCKTRFGGHEWQPVLGHECSVPDQGRLDRGKAICPACVQAGEGDRAWADARAAAETHATAGKGKA